MAKLFRTIASQTLPVSEVIVVDNGSTDGAAELATESGARVIRFQENRGFAAAINRGVLESKGELIAVLNSDVELAPDWMALLANSADVPGVFFAIGQILARDKRAIDGCWDLISKAGMPWRAGSGATVGHPAFQQRRKVEMASFTAILLHRELWKRIGALDESFESYLEDVDYGLRCVAAGLYGVYEPKAVCVHHGSATLGRWNRESVRRMSRNQVFLVRKHLAAGWWTFCVGQGLWGLVALRHGAGLAWLQGKIEGWKRRGEFSRGQVNVQPLEKQILALQAEMGGDAYWTWYARLTGAELRPNDTPAPHE